MTTKPKTTKHDDPGAFTLRPVRTSDTYSKAVEGGFVRAKVTEGGIIVALVDREIFISDTALAAVGRHR